MKHERRDGRATTTSREEANKVLSNDSQRFQDQRHTQKCINGHGRRHDQHHNNTSEEQGHTSSSPICCQHKSTIPTQVTTHRMHRIHHRTHHYSRRRQDAKNRVHKGGWNRRLVDGSEPEHLARTTSTIRTGHVPSLPIVAMSGSTVAILPPSDYDSHPYRAPIWPCTVPLLCFFTGTSGTARRRARLNSARLYAPYGAQVQVCPESCTAAISVRPQVTLDNPPVSNSLHVHQ